MQILWLLIGQLRELVDTAEATGTKITPWFKLIGENFLYKWWDNMNDLSQFAVCINSTRAFEILYGIG